MVQPLKNSSNALTPQQIAETLLDFDAYSAAFLKIKTKDQQIAAFKKNSSQARLYARIVDTKKQGKPVRVVILKARQIGFSTLTEALLFHATTTNYNTNALIVAHEDKASTNLFDMSKLYLDCLPRKMQPMTKASNAKELIFENPSKEWEDRKDNPGLRSRISIQTAKNVKASRSGTNHLVHISELAFWDQPDAAMTAIMQTVPSTPQSMVIVESTANGLGNYYHKLYTDAVEGKNDFIPFFVAWHEHDEYTMEAPEDYTPTAEDDPIYGNEVALQQAYNLTREQLYWRRWTIKNRCNNDINIFRQEYPSNDAEAFLSSGTPRFVQSTLDWYKGNRLIVPIATGNIEREPSGKYVLINSELPNLTMYQRHKPKGQYLISADVAEGLEKGDYSCAKVWDLETWDLVAEWHGHIEHKEFGTVLCELGRIYNHALLAPEANNHGASTITQIRNELYPEELLFEGHMVMNRADDDYRDPAKRYGWLTTTKTKRLIINNLASKLELRELQGLTEADIKELRTYIRATDGTTNAQEGCFDDRVMTLAIGLYLLCSETFAQHYPTRSLNHAECYNCKHCTRLKTLPNTEGICKLSGRWVQDDFACQLFQRYTINALPKQRKG